MNLSPIASIGTHHVETLHGRVALAAYPETPDVLALRRVRRVLGLTHTEAAKRIGVTSLEYHRMEAGALAPADWPEAHRRLRRYKPLASFRPAWIALALHAGRMLACSRDGRNANLSLCPETYRDAYDVAHNEAMRLRLADRTGTDR